VANEWSASHIWSGSGRITPVTPCDDSRNALWWPPRRFGVTKPPLATLGSGHSHSRETLGVVMATPEAHRGCPDHSWWESRVAYTTPKCFGSGRTILGTLQGSTTRRYALPPTPSMAGRPPPTTHWNGQPVPRWFVLNYYYF
jgi:hypothetical protein